MINKIGKITLYVNNQEEAKNFWINQMNFEIKFEQAMGPNMTWLEVGPKGDSYTTFVLYDKELMKVQNPEANIGHPSVILSTDNIENTHKELKNNNVKASDIAKMPYGSMFQFYDNDDNVYLVREDC